MKKSILYSLLGVLAVFTVIYAGTSAGNFVTGDVSLTTPDNIRVVKLGTCNSGTNDTLASAAANVYGPYNLSKDGTRPQATQLRFLTRVGSLSTGDSLQSAFQVIGGPSLSDTGSTWTSWDTLINGKKGRNIPLDSIPGSFIVFRLYNYTVSNSALIQAPIRVVFKEPEVVSPDSKH